MTTSLRHSILRELLLRAPGLAGDLAARAGIPMPHGAVHVLPGEFEQTAARVRAADLVVRFGPRRKRVVLIAEIQLGRDPEKLWTWLEYVTECRSRFRCRVLLLVLVPDAAMARWARRVLTADPWIHFQHLVVDLSQMPIPDEEDQGPWLAERLLFAAMAHGRGPAASQIARMAPRALEAVDAGQRTLIVDILMQHLSNKGRALLEELVLTGYRFQHPMLRDAQEKGIELGLERGIEEGRREAAAEIVHILLNQRGYLGAREVVASASAHDLSSWVQELVQGVLPAPFAG